MVSYFEVLATELLEEIASYLRSQVGDIARLLRCNKSLRRYLEPILYGNSELRYRAMRWGCTKGNSDIIRRAVAYGASVSILEIPSRKVAIEGTQRKDLTVHVSTLYLAAKYRKTDAFRCLLELGARVPEQDHVILAHQARLLIDCICSCSGSNIQSEVDIVRLFLKTRLDSEVKKSAGVATEDQMLVRVIKAGASPEVVISVLDQEPDPNQIWPAKKHRIIMSALSAAMFADSPQVFSLLLSRGADVHGKEFKRPTVRAQHIPIFAAAHIMATESHGISMIDMCLENGADINHRSPITGSYGAVASHRRWVRSDDYCNATPVYVYLDSIVDWYSDKKIVPAEGLKYLIQHGASVQSIHDERDLYTPYEPPNARVSVLEMLLMKWGPDEMVFREFRDVVRLLVEHDAAKDDIAYLLTMITPRTSPVYPWFPPVRSASGANQLTDLLLATIEPDEASDLLCYYATFLEDECYVLDKKASYVLRGLIKAGADINKPSNGIWSKHKPMPVLHNICSSINRQHSSTWISTYLRRREMAETEKLLRYLLQKGADPNLIVEGRTAFEIILAGIDGMRESSRDRLTRIESLLREEFQPKNNTVILVERRRREDYGGTGSTG
jgi:hypothetical protein